MPISSSNTKGNESRRTLSSMSPSSNNASRNQSLSKEFFAELVKLETEFHSQKYSIQTLDELVQHYAKAVEYYDSIQDEITSYFTFKIQDTLATRRSLGMLIDQKQKGENDAKDVSSPSPTKVSKTNSRAKGRTVSLNTMELESMMIKETYGEESSDEEGETFKREQWQKKRENKNDKSLATMKNQRQKFVQFYHKVEVEKVNQEQDVHTVVNDYHSSVQEIDNLVKNGIDKQKERLRQKLEKKKNASFLSFSLNNSMNLGAGENRSVFNLNEQIMKKDFLLNSNMGSNNNSVIFNDSDEIEEFDGDKQRLPMDLSEDITLSPSSLSPGKYQKHARCKSLFTKKEDNSSSKANLFSLLKKEEERETQEENVFYSNNTPAKSSTDDSCNNINMTPGSSTESGTKSDRLEA